MYRPASLLALLSAAFAIASCSDSYPLYASDTPRAAYEAGAQNEINAQENTLRLERQQQQSEALLRGQSQPPHTPTTPEELSRAERELQQLRQSDDQNYPAARDRMDNALHDLDRRARMPGSSQ